MPLACEINRNHKKKAWLNFIKFIDDFKKKYARIFDRDDSPAPKYKKLVSGGYILHHIKSLDNSFFGIGLLVKFVTRQSLRKNNNNNNNNLVPRVFPPSPRENPRTLRLTNIAALTSQASSLLTLVSHLYLSLGCAGQSSG